MAGPVWIEDNSIGQALSGLADSFSGLRGAQMANVQSEIWMRNLQREQLKRQLAAQDEAIAAENARQGNFQAPTPGTDAWVKSGGVVGTETVPQGGPAPLQLKTSPVFAQQDADAAKSFDLERKKALATYQLGARSAKSMEDVAGATPKLAGQAQVAEYGLPTSPQGLAALQTQLTGQVPGVDQKTATGYAVLDSNGQVVGRGVTHNFQTDAGTGQRIAAPQGGSVVKMGDLAADAGPLKDQGARAATINNGVQQVARGEQIGQAQALTIAQALAQEHPDTVKLEKDDVGNLRPVVVPERPMSKVFAPLVDELNRSIAGTRPPPAASAFDRGAPPVSMPSLPGVTPQAPETANIGGTAGTPTTPAPAPTAAQPPPIIPTPGAVTATAGAPVVAGTGSDLQKEMFNSQFYRQYSDSMVAFNNIKDAMKADNQSADLRAIYALAKLYDPGSVVREGELKLSQNASSLAERLAGLYNGLSGSGARLTPSQRADIMQEAYGAARQQYEAMNVKNRDAADRAQRLGLDPRNVTVPIQEPVPLKAEEISSIKRGGTTGAPAAPAGPAARSALDQEALRWANANPNDPRAAKIKQQLGAQ